jgi:hypothetical protein
LKLLHHQGNASKKAKNEKRKMSADEEFKVPPQAATSSAPAVPQYDASRQKHRNPHQKTKPAAQSSESSDGGESSGGEDVVEKSSKAKSTDKDFLRILAKKFERAQKGKGATPTKADEINFRKFLEGERVAREQKARDERVSSSLTSSSESETSSSSGEDSEEDSKDEGKPNIKSVSSRHSKAGKTEGRPRIVKAESSSKKKRHSRDHRHKHKRGHKAADSPPMTLLDSEDDVSGSGDSGLEMFPGAKAAEARRAKKPNVVYSGSSKKPTTRLEMVANFLNAINADVESCRDRLRALSSATLEARELLSSALEAEAERRAKEAQAAAAAAPEPKSSKKSERKKKGRRH